MKKKYLRIGDWKRNVLIMATASCLGLTACNNGDQAEQGNTSDWSSGNSNNTQGVITELTEISPNNWRISDERPAGPGQVAAIMRHYDGKVDTLRGEALQRQMQQHASVNQGGHNNGFSMMNVLMWSSLGYMAGRMMSPNPRYYTSPQVMQRTSSFRNSVFQQRTSRGMGSSGGTFRRSAPSGRTGVFSGRSGGFYS